jgi:DNA repair protein RadC
MTQTVIYKNAGHRNRLRKRFLQSGLSGFLDYEIIELLLTLGTPRKDCKQTAKEVLKKFKNLRGVLEATSEDLQTIKGIGPSNVLGLKLFQAVSERYSKDSIPKKITLNSSRFVANYLQKNIGLEKKEYFIVLLLDSRNNLIKKSNISIGSLNSNIVHPREVFKEAIQNSASQIIIAHNHPSNDINPSPEDIALTRRLSDAAKIIGVDLIDHFIVSKDNYCSFKEKNLL